MMIDQTQLISSAFPLVGGGAIGFATGFVIKKIMKLAFIGLGLVMLVLGFLEYKPVNSKISCSIFLKVDALM